MKKNLPAYITQDSLHRFIQQAFAEDIGPGDHTTNSIFSEEEYRKSKVLVKGEGILAGVEMALQIMKTLDPEVTHDLHIIDGTPVKYGDIAIYFEGKTRSLLTAERLILNCMQRMSAVATKTNALVKKIEHTDCKLLDTRKTTPNFRIAEKWAVEIGGGVNHRFALYDAVMIKDNHIDYCGGLPKALNRVNEYLAKNELNIPIIIEVRNRKEIDEALVGKNVTRLLLDNFSPEKLVKEVEYINGSISTEASGGINSDTLVSYAETGVDYCSMGALTHSYSSLDISMKAV